MVTRFIESFDTVRFADASAVAERKLHAEIELMLSILFGEPMVVPEPYSFDSLGFLEISRKVLDSRPTKECLESSVWNPFKLALREGHDDFKAVMGDLFGNQGFKLSAWPDIVNNDRKSLGDLIRNDKYKEAITAFPGEKGKLEQLKMLDYYFKNNITKAENFGNRLGEYIENDLKNITDKSDGEIVRLKGGIDTLKREFESENNGREDRAKLRIAKRSDVYTHGSKHLSTKTFKMVLEYIDSRYSHVVAEAVGAGRAIFTTRGSGDNDDVNAGEKFANSFYKFRDEQWKCGAFLIDPHEGLNALKIDWERIWDIVTDRAWIESVKHLQTAASSGERASKVEALNKHIELLSENLSGLVEYVPLTRVEEAISIIVKADELKYVLRYIITSGSSNIEESESGIRGTQSRRKRFIKGILSKSVRVNE